jgi:hypothetical protein
MPDPGVPPTAGIKNGGIKKYAYHFAPETLRNGRLLAILSRFQVFSIAEQHFCGRTAKKRCVPSGFLFGFLN